MRYTLSVLLLCCITSAMLANDFAQYSPADSILYVQFHSIEPYSNDYVLLRFKNYGYDVDLPSNVVPGRVQATDGTPGHLLVCKDSTDGLRWFYRSTDFGESWSVVPRLRRGGHGYAGRNPNESWIWSVSDELSDYWTFFTSDGWLSCDSARIPTLIGGGPDSVRIFSLSYEIGTLYGIRQTDRSLCVSADTGHTWAVGSVFPSQITQHAGCGAPDEIWYRLFNGAHVVIDTGRIDLGELFSAYPRYPHTFPWQSDLVPTDHFGEAYLVLWYDEWPPPPNWSLMHMWVYHIRNYGAVVDSSYHLFLDFVPLAVEPEWAVLPQSLYLRVFPNPLNSTMQIAFAVPTTQRVSLRLYDVLGREAAVLLDEMRIAGEHRVRFDGGGLPSGVYFCRMEAGTEIRTQKIVLMR